MDGARERASRLKGDTFFDSEILRISRISSAGGEQGSGGAEERRSGVRMATQGMVGDGRRGLSGGQVQRTRQLRALSLFGEQLDVVGNDHRAAVSRLYHGQR